MEYESYYIYCDESCHLPNDDSNVMVLGALYFPKNHKRKISQDIRLLPCYYSSYNIMFCSQKRAALFPAEHATTLRGCSTSTTLAMNGNEC